MREAMDPQQERSGETPVIVPFFPRGDNKDAYVLIFGIFGNAYKLSPASNSAIWVVNIGFGLSLASLMLAAYADAMSIWVAVVLALVCLVASILLTKLIVVVKAEPYISPPVAKRWDGSLTVFANNKIYRRILPWCLGYLLFCCVLAAGATVFLLIDGDIAKQTGLLAISISVALFVAVIWYYRWLKRALDRRLVS